MPIGTVFSEDLPWDCARCERPFSLGQRCYEADEGWICEPCSEREYVETNEERAQ